MRNILFTFGLVALQTLLGSSACAEGEYLGESGAAVTTARWVVIGSPSVSAGHPLPGSDREAILQRGATDNRLDFEISPIQDTSIWSSFHAQMYSILMRFTGPRPFTAPVSVFLPVMHSNRFQNLTWTVDTSSRLVLRVEADRAGLDLFEASLFAPGGLMGTATFGSPAQTVFLSANPRQAGTGVATVVVTKTKRASTVIRLRSEVEFPMVVETVQGKGAVRRVQKTLGPWKSMRLRLPWRTEDASELSIRTGVARTVPQQIQQRYP